MKLSARLLLLPLTLLGLAACDDGITPPEVGFEAAALARDIAELEDRMSVFDTAAANLAEARASLEGLGFEADRAVPPGVSGDPFAGPLGPVAADLAAALPAMPVTIPPELAGSTLVYDPDTFAWVVAESRTDGPETGVRIIWYLLDTTARPVEPLQELGYIDLVPATLEGLDALDMTVVRVADGSEMVILDFTQAVEVTAEPERSERVEASGTYGTGAEAVAFDISYSFSDDSVADVQSLLLETELVAETLVLTSTTSGETAGDVSEDLYSTTVDRNGQLTVMNLTIDTDASGDATVDGSFLHEGEEEVLIRVVDGLYVFTSPDGDEFGASDSSSLRDLLQAMLVTPLGVFFQLPLLFPGG